jgi:hypothetical protein
VDLGFAAATAVVTDANRVDEVFAELGVRWSGALNVLINTVGPVPAVHSSNSPTSSGGPPSTTA